MARKGAVTKPRDTPGYTRTKVTYKGGTRRADAPNIDWYMQPPEELYEQVFGRVRQIKGAQVTRRFELYTYQQAYNSRFGQAMMGSLFSPGARNPSAGFYGISCNIIKSCIDTACSKVSKGDPKAFVLPNKGDYRLKKKCRNLTKFLDGTMKHAGVYDNAKNVFRDACIYGDGALLLECEDGEIRSEAVKIDELWIDAVDGMYDKPREMHWVHPMPRRELLKRYPEFAEEIEMARSAWHGEMSFMGSADMVEVVKSWRVPSTAGGDDGRRTVCIPTATLLSEPWTKDYIPIVRFHWSEPTYGPFGDGIAKELFGLQRALSDILRGILKSIRMFAVPRIWVERMSRVVQVNNELGVNEYSGTPPVFDTPPAASADIYSFVQWIIDYAYKQIGLSQMTAQSEKPPGLNAAVALRTYQDVETQRFAIVGQRWEAWYMQVANVILDLAEDEYKKSKSLSVTVAGRGFIESIDWKDASVKRDLFDVGVWPTSILPDSPEGKRQEATEWTTSGFMPKDVALSQMRMPIMNDWIDNETAPRDMVERMLSSIIDDGKYIAPDSITKEALDLAVSLSAAALMRAPDEDVEPHKIELLQRFFLEASAKQTTMNSPPPAMPGMPGAPPGGPVVGQAAAPPPAPLAPNGAGPVQVPS